MNVQINKLLSSLISALVLISCNESTDKLKNLPEETKPNQGSIVQYSDDRNVLEKRTKDSTVFNFQNGLSAIVSSKVIRIYDTHNALMAYNNNIIKLQDESHNCISEGFLDIVDKQNYFTIEQQSCSNKYFINEYITFIYFPKDSQIILHKLGYVFHDKMNPDAKPTEKKFSKIDFGEIGFDNTNIDSLYYSLINKSD
ncbi:MAG: hypothetical protein ACTIJ9_11275 [Aequorivita sp.]